MAEWTRIKLDLQRTALTPLWRQLDLQLGGLTLRLALDDERVSELIAGLSHAGRRKIPGIARVEPVTLRASTPGLVDGGYVHLTLAQLVGQKQILAENLLPQWAREGSVPISTGPMEAWCVACDRGTGATCRGCCRPFCADCSGAGRACCRKCVSLGRS